MKLLNKILVCAGGGCIASGSLMVKAAIQKETKGTRIDDKVFLLKQVAWDLVHVVRL
jgi:hypothetical protein